MAFSFQDKDGVSNFDVAAKRMTVRKMDGTLYPIWDGAKLNVPPTPTWETIEDKPWFVAAGNSWREARQEIHAASDGVNSDITELQGLEKPLSVTQGGTGGNSPYLARIGLGLGTSATLDVGLTPGTVASGADPRLLAVADKADEANVLAALALKADEAPTFALIQTKADSSAMATELGKKADKTTMTTELGKKADKTTMTSALNGKIDKTTAPAVGVRGGVATYPVGLPQLAPDGSNAVQLVGYMRQALGEMGLFRDP